MRQKNVKEKKCIWKKKRFLIFSIGILLLGCFFAPELSGGVYPDRVSAKVPNGVKKKAAKAYRKFMYENICPWFYLKDINRDGIKELIVSDYGGYNPGHIMVYTYRKGRVQEAGKDQLSFGHWHNKRTKRLHGSWGACGNMEYWYLTLTKSGKLKRVSLSRYVKDIVNGEQIYEYSYAGKKISKAAYDRKSKSWYSSDILKMHKASIQNIRKYIR